MNGGRQLDVFRNTAGPMTVEVTKIMEQLCGSSPKTLVCSQVALAMQKLLCVCCVTTTSATPASSPRQAGRVSRRDRERKRERDTHTHRGGGGGKVGGTRGGEREGLGKGGREGGRSLRKGGREEGRKGGRDGELVPVFVFFFKTINRSGSSDESKPIKRSEECTLQSALFQYEGCHLD